MAHTKEYLRNEVITYDQVRLLLDVQDGVIDRVSGKIKDYDLKEIVSTASTVLGIFFMIAQPAAFVIAVSGLIATMAPSEKRELLATLKQGRDGIYEIEKFLYKNKKNYDAVKADILYLEYREEGFRVVQNDNINITSVHGKGGWEV